MSDKPILIFPTPTIVDRHKGTSGPSKLQFPTEARQLARVAPKFETLERVFAAHQASFRTSIEGLEPEQVLVLETVGQVTDFYKAVKRIEGLEWLVEWEEEIPSDNDFKKYKNDADDDADQKKHIESSDILSGRLYLIMHNQQGLRQLLSLWNIFRTNPESRKFEWGTTKWRDLFKQLKELRPWGPEDRIRETGLLEDWKERVALKEETVRIEIELWFRSKETDRNNATGQVSNLIAEENGRVINQCLIEEIAYHALLAELPIGSVEKILNDRNTKIVLCDQIMFFRPTGQSVTTIPEDDFDLEFSPEEITSPSKEDPIIALFDALPLQNHELLSKHLIVDDPDEWNDTYPADIRFHGTAMASLIIHGELDANEETLSYPIYVRPILKPNSRLSRLGIKEEAPENILFTDLIHRAVIRMLDGEGDEAPSAPTVRIINFSIGDKSRLFDSFPSSLARLIDYLSWKYEVLFIISAGNHGADIELDCPRADFPNLKLNRDRLEREALKTIIQNNALRRLLSPAESINAITVGATHEDRSQFAGNGDLINFYQDGFPSPINAQGPGFRRSIKPEVLFSGGKQIYREKIGNTHEKATLKVGNSVTPPGHKVASPSTQAGNISSVTYTRGTSNATALASRTAAKLYEIVEQLQNEPNGETLSDPYLILIVKSLLVHSASWKDWGTLIETITNKKDKNLIARLLGYGTVEPSKVLSCTDQRCTLIGFGGLQESQAHLYSIPLPSCLNSKAVWRRLTITLSWFTPVNINHGAYRKAALWFEPYGADKSAKPSALLQVYRAEADGRSARRGTVQHEIFEGNRASVFEDGEQLQIQVNCKEDAGKLTEEIPYSLVATLEVAEQEELPIYEEIRQVIHQPVEIKP